LTRLAAIDIGTNSVLLTVAEVRRTEHGASLVALVERARITRLGQGVDRSRELHADAVERTLACLRDYASELRGFGVAALDIVGTSALRDAGGGERFVEQAEAVLGVRPRVIGGDEEAELTFAGALSGLDVTGPITVFDVGGGSTEVIHGSWGRGPDARTIDFATSLDIGSVRLFERYGSSDPPTEWDLALAQRDVDSALTQAGTPSKNGTLVGVAGTVTTLAAIARELTSYDCAKVHGARLEAGALSALYDRLRSLPLSERRALPGLEPGRADVIVFGALIVCAVVGWGASSSLLASDRGVRWGLLERAASRLR
jgi:exopolyphosphatase / guanosine-5'-triphosphate,3'-diphosphate pyrophosphatase